MNNEERIWENNFVYTNLLHGRVLDAGAGLGNYSYALSKLPQVTKVVSLDLFPPSTEVPNSLLSTWVQGTVESLPFADNSFDCVFCWRVMQYVTDGVKALIEFSRIASRVMIRMPIDPYGKPPSHALSYREEFNTGKREKLTWRVYWNPSDLEEGARIAGLIPVSPTHVDITNSMIRVFERIH